MGIGGYYMALNMSGSFNSNCWINGYGWIAVALVIFANWNPALAILGTFVFGFFNTLRVSGSSLAAAFPEGLGWLAAVPTQLYQALPFIITAVVLVVTSVRKRGLRPASGAGPQLLPGGAVRRFPSNWQKQPPPFGVAAVFAVLRRRCGGLPGAGFFAGTSFADLTDGNGSCGEEEHREPREGAKERGEKGPLERGHK